MCLFSHLDIYGNEIVRIQVVFLCTFSLTLRHWWQFLGHLLNLQKSCPGRSRSIQPPGSPCALHCPSDHQIRVASPLERHCIFPRICHGSQNVWWRPESLGDLRNKTGKHARGQVTECRSPTPSRFCRHDKDSVTSMCGSCRSLQRKMWGEVPHGVKSNVEHFGQNS